MLIILHEIIKTLIKIDNLASECPRLPLSLIFYFIADSCNIAQ